MPPPSCGIGCFRKTTNRLNGTTSSMQNRQLRSVRDSRFRTQPERIVLYCGSSVDFRGWSRLASFAEVVHRHTDTERTCYLCLELLPNDQFTRRTDGTYFSACKACNRLVFAQRRRARLLGADGSFTRAEFEALVARTARCPRCNRAWKDIPPPPNCCVIHADHIKAVSKGGTNFISNCEGPGLVDSGGGEIMSL
jgi:hypothetical protein